MTSISKPGWTPSEKTIRSAASAAQRTAFLARTGEDDTAEGAVFTTRSGLRAIRINGVSVPYLHSVYGDPA